LRSQFIQPGKPQQNVHVELYNRTARYDWLAHYLFDSTEEVQDFATGWLWTYNYERPNMAIGGTTKSKNWPWPLSVYFELRLKMNFG
jgi:putative transposase